MRPGFLLIRKNQNNNPVFGGASVYDLCLAGLLPAGWCSNNFHTWKLILLSQTDCHDFKGMLVLNSWRIFVRYGCLSASFIQKVTDFYATALDYDKDAKTTRQFFKWFRIRCRRNVVYE